MNAHIEAQFLRKITLWSKAEVDYMAAEPRVTARDLVKVVGGKDGGGRERQRKTAKERERGKERLKGSEGFLFQISPDPQGSSVLVASSTQINLFHQRKHSGHSGLASNAENQQQLHTLATLTRPVEELAQLIIENSHPSTCPGFFFHVLI